MQQPTKDDVGLFRAFQKSPFLWIEKNLGLVPQPLKDGVADDMAAEQYKPHHFEDFVLGEHLTWQQWLFFRAVEWAIQGKASRFITVTSGHGTAKTTDLAILILWFLFCFKDSQVPTTAPTADQLYDVLWKEIANWRNRLKPEVRDLYEMSTQYVRIVESPETWFARARTARKEAPEALAGIHAPHILMIADESSGIAEEIFETGQGALTNKNVLFIMTSNPTRLTGFFYESHHKNRDQYQRLRFNSEESPIVEKDYCERMAREYGRESNQYMVRVLGLFPTAEAEQFIPMDLFETALHKKVASLDHEPRILAVDPARFGDDRTGIVERKGRNARLLKTLRGQDTMAVVGQVIAAINEARKEGEAYDYVLVDEIGIGAGIVDRLKEQKIDVIGVNVSEKPRREDCKNLTAELWYLMKEWLKEGHLTEDFRDDLIGRQYSFDSSGRLVMERKEDMKKRGLASPDLADALCLTFYPLNPIKRQLRGSRRPMRRSTGHWGAIGM